MRRDSDVALVIKYQFHDQENFPEDPCEENTAKKRKIPSAASRNVGVLDYSRIKLSAAMFGYYLEAECLKFSVDCHRYLP